MLLAFINAYAHILVHTYTSPHAPTHLPILTRTLTHVPSHTYTHTHSTLNLTNTDGDTRKETQPPPAGAGVDATGSVAYVVASTTDFSPSLAVEALVQGINIAALRQELDPQRIQEEVACAINATLHSAATGVSAKGGSANMTWQGILDEGQQQQLQQQQQLGMQYAWLQVPVPTNEVDLPSY